MALKKLCLLIGVTVMSALSSLYADNDQPINASPSRGTSSTQNKPYQREIYREITPNAGPRVVHGVDLFITADFIYWEAIQKGTQYAAYGVKTGQTIGATFTPALPGKTKEVGKDWSPGFRVGVGLNLSHDGWDLYSRYTWLQTSKYNSIKHSENGIIVDTLGVSSIDASSTLTGDQAAANWQHYLNVIDLELGRNFYLSQNLTMRPFIGLKGTWQDQDLKIKFFSSKFALQNDQHGLTAVTGPYRTHYLSDVWGIGLRGGANTHWSFCKDWSVYGRCALTTMCAKYPNVKRRDKIEDTTTNTSTPLAHLDSDHTHAINYVGELELGVSWEVWFDDDNYHAMIQAGWENQVWLNWTRFLKTSNSTWNDLSFQGLNIKFRFDF